MSDDTAMLLDAIDRRLALGEIDLATYNMLKAKFSRAPVAGEESLKKAVESMTKEAVAIRCPGCMAALNPGSPDATTVKCEYCGGTFALQVARSEMEQLKDGIRKWLSEMAGKGGSGGTVDEAARSFIFRDKLLPALSMEADRATESFSFTRHQALFEFPLLKALPSYPFLDAVNATPDVGYLVSRVKSIIARVQDPQVMTFAVDDRARARLSSIEMQCQEVIYLGNARKSAHEQAVAGFSTAVTNLTAAQTLYEKSAHSSEAAQSTFLRGLTGRTKAVAEATRLLADCIESQSAIATHNYLERLESLAVDCELAASLIDSCGMEPKDTIPALEGVRADAQTIRLFASTLRIYEECALDAGIPFPDFMNSLTEMTRAIRPLGATTAWLSEFLINVVRIGGASRGSVPVPLVNRFDTVESRAQQGVKSSLFGGRETVTINERFYIPFWIAHLHSTEQTGVLLRKGHFVESVLLLDASCPNGACFPINQSALKPDEIQAAVAQPRTDSGRDFLLPVVDREMARKQIRFALAHTPQLVGATAMLEDLVFLPAATVVYSRKSESRAQRVTCAACSDNIRNVTTRQIGSWRISHSG